MNPMIDRRVDRLTRANMDLLEIEIVAQGDGWWLVMQDGYEVGFAASRKEAVTCAKNYADFYRQDGEAHAARGEQS